MATNRTRTIVRCQCICRSTGALLIPDLERIMTYSDNHAERLHYWNHWRRAAVAPSREQFLRLLQLLHLESRLNGKVTSLL